METGEAKYHNQSVETIGTTRCRGSQDVKDALEYEDVNTSQGYSKN